MPPKEISTDAEAIFHLENCPGCTECDILLEFYETCEFCGKWGHKDVMAKSIVDGECKAFCFECEGKR